MKRLKLIFIIILFSCATVFASTQQLASEKLSQLLNGFTTIQAHFTQESVDVTQQVLQKSNGVVMIERPGKFRWETQQPSHQVVITNGKKLWVYDVDLKQATEQSIAKSAINPAKLLSGNVNDLLKQFTYHMIPHKDIVVFQLIPKKPNPQFRSVAIAFLHDKLSGMQIENNMEQTTTFNFSDVKLNEPLSPSLFEFNPPLGVDVLR